MSQRPFSQETTRDNAFHVYEAKKKKNGIQETGHPTQESHDGKL